MNLIVERRRLTQIELAATLVINPRRDAGILHGELESFSVAQLMHFLVTPGLDVEIVVKPRPHSRFARIAVKAA